MKIVHTSDWHIGKSLNEYSLLDDQRHWLLQFIDMLSKIKPDALLIAGDIYDRSVPSAEAISLVDEVLSKIVLNLKIKTYIISGNHDSKERISFAGGILARSGLYMTGKVSCPIKKISDDTSDIYMLPYYNISDIKALFKDDSIKTADESIKTILKETLENLNKEKINILICHGTFSHGWSDVSEQVGGSEQIDCDIFKPFDYVAMGHLHSFINVSNNKMIYSSSPLKYSIDEEKQKKGFVEADINKGKVSILFHEIPPLHDVKTIQGLFNDIVSQKSNDYIFFNLIDEKPVINGFMRLKSKYPNALGMKYINLSGKSFDFKYSNKLKFKQPADIFAEFYHSVNNKELSEKQKDIIKSAFNNNTEA